MPALFDLVFYFNIDLLAKSSSLLIVEFLTSDFYDGPRLFGNIKSLF